MLLRCQTFNSMRGRTQIAPPGVRVHNPQQVPRLGFPIPTQCPLPMPHLDLVEHLRVGGGGHKGDGQALGAKAAGAADAVQVSVSAVAVLLVCGRAGGVKGR